MQLNYRETNNALEAIDLITDCNVKVTFYYGDENTASTVAIAGSDYDNDTSLDGIYVKVEGAFVSIADVLIKADDLMKQHRRENIRDAADYANHIRTMSSQWRYL